MTTKKLKPSDKLRQKEKAAMLKRCQKLKSQRYTLREIGEREGCTGQYIGQLLKDAAADHIAESRAKSRIPTLSKARKIKLEDL